jgi:excisionase family DNA binding protein
MPDSERRLLLNVSEVSELTGISVGTLYHWVSERRIPFVRLSARCVRFRRTDLEAWVAGLVEQAKGKNENPLPVLRTHAMTKDHRANDTKIVPSCRAGNAGRKKNLCPIPAQEQESK